MIAEERIREAELMLARGKMSQREVAKRTGLSRGTISLIARGKRTIQVKTVDPDVLPESEDGPPVRCITCGSIVKMPCLLCHLKNLAARNRPVMRLHFHLVESSPAMTNTQHSPNSTLRLGINLTGDELKRYQEVRAWREKCANPYFVDIPEEWPWRRGVASDEWLEFKIAYRSHHTLMPHN